MAAPAIALNAADEPFPVVIDLDHRALAVGTGVVQCQQGRRLFISAAGAAAQAHLTCLALLLLFSASFAHLNRPLDIGSATVSLPVSGLS
jgi:hypothetical protein